MIVAGLDIETTGLLHPDHRIIEVYAGLWQLPSRDQVFKFEQRIDPERSIAADAQRVHGISSSMLVGKPTWSQVAPDLAKVIAKADLVVAHNGDGFDKPFLVQEFNRVGMSIPVTPWLDTMLEGRFAMPMGHVPSLQALCFACDVPYDPTLAHAAAYDVEVLTECFFRALDWGFFALPASLTPKEDTALVQAA